MATYGLNVGGSAAKEDELGTDREHKKRMVKMADEIAAKLPHEKAEALLVLGLVMQKLATEVVQLVSG